MCVMVESMAGGSCDDVKNCELVSRSSSWWVAVAAAATVAAVAVVTVAVAAVVGVAE